MDVICRLEILEKTPKACSGAQCDAGRGLKLDVSIHIGRQPQYQ